MTHIVSFEVDGLAGRRDSYRVDLDPDANIFFGKNGTGKTTLLKILYAALRNETRLIKDAPFESATVTFFSRDRDALRTRTFFRDASPSEEFQASFTDGSTQLLAIKDDIEPVWQTSPRDNRSYRASFLSISRVASAGSRSARSLYELTSLRHDRHEEETAINEAFSNEIRALWRQYSNSLLSEVTQVQQQGIAEIMRSLFTTDRSRARPALSTMEAFTRTNDFLHRQGVESIGTLAQFRKRYEEDKRVRTIVDNIYGIERRIESAEDPRRRLEELLGSLIGGNKQITFSNNDIVVSGRNGITIALGSLSSGEKQLIRILMETILAGESPVIIDEPELSMHIDWQVDLLDNLKTVNPECQIIVATHSPEIMAEVHDDRIFRL